MSFSSDEKRSGIGSTIKTGINIFNQGKPGSTTERIINQVSGPSGLNMSDPSNYSGNAIKITFTNFAR